MHRLMVTSSTYRQSSNHRPESARIDPENQALWRYPRQRLEGEAIRDSSLAVSGLLNPQMEGPSIFPELPPGLEVRGGWKASEDESLRNRSSIYVFVRRNTRYPLFESFDMPDTHETCSRRNNTVTPGQALNLLNSPTSFQWAEAFAGRVHRAAGSNNRADRVKAAFELAFSRPPTASDFSLSEAFFKTHREWIQQRAETSQPIPAPRHIQLAGRDEQLEAAVLVDFCHMLLNANEFVYRN